MSSADWLYPARRAAMVAVGLLLAAGAASAQVAVPVSESGDSPHQAAVASAYSSSNEPGSSERGLGMLGDSAAADPTGTPAAPAAANGGNGGQYDNSAGTGSHDWKSKLTYEAGGGFNSPIGNDGPYITWGGNVTGGAGLRFTKRISILGEFQFIVDKLPGAFVAAGGGTTGNAHIISITADPTFDLFPKHNNSAYLVVGGGYYHKSTNFNIQECCDFYGYPVTVTANSFASNQAGVNGGLGITHRFGGMYNEGTTKVFAEVRYVYINTPGLSSTNGLGTTGLIPVTFGVRF